MSKIFNYCTFKIKTNYFIIQTVGVDILSCVVPVSGPCMRPNSRTFEKILRLRHRQCF